MNVLKRCCLRSLKENRKRTIVTIVGVILATSLITAVACMVVSFRASMILYEKQMNGDFHYCFEGVRLEDLKYFRNNRNIDRVSMVGNIGYAVLEGSRNPDKPYLYISGLDDEGQRMLSLQLVEGRMPQTDTELVIGRHIRTNGLVDLQVGDVLDLQVGDRISGEKELDQNDSYAYEEEVLRPAFTKRYTIVGIMERPNNMVENRLSPGYSAFTYMGEGGADYNAYSVYTVYTPWGVRHAEQVTAGILGISEDLYRRYYTDVRNYTAEEEARVRAVARMVRENYWLLKWELLTFSSGTMNMLYAMSAIAVLVIIVTGVFCIRNSFVISLTEKMKMYGRLASVGTTSRQQKKIVYYEAVFLGGVGIPLGILSGLAASWILVRAVGGLVEDAVQARLVFGFSPVSVVVAAVLSAVTIFFSASKSARRAARLSPISAIRAADSVRTGQRKLHCPKLVGRLFGIGGTIAYKNLKRARVKYRTTVISIVVSVAVFIGMTTFVQVMFLASDVYKEEVKYQISVSIYGSDSYGEALRVAALEGVEEAEVVRTARFTVDAGQIPYEPEYRNLFPDEAGDAGQEEYITVMTLGEEAYARYCGEVGVSVRDAEDKAIVISGYKQTIHEGDRIYVEEGNTARYRPGDVIVGTGDCEGVEIPVLVRTDKRPLAVSDTQPLVLIVSDSWLEKQPISEEIRYVNVNIRCQDADMIEQMVRSDLEPGNYSVNNYNASYRAERSMYLLVAIFLYGFIAVVALIGVTNIFNTITTNMELRAPEFAMLRAVGMTGREFRHMIWLETLFYAGKALAVGIPAGVMLSYGFHRALGRGIVTSFRFPWLGIAAASAAVAVLLIGIMRYSMGKIRRKNIIDTIRNENI